MQIAHFRAPVPAVTASNINCNAFAAETRLLRDVMLAIFPQRMHIIVHFYDYFRSNNNK